MPRAKSACATAGSKTMRRADRRVIPRLAPALLALALAGWAATAGEVVLTGEVRATDAQVIYTPFSNSSPVVIRFFVPEGERVEKGDPDRKSVVEGKSGSVRVDLGGRRVIKKKKTKKESIGAK